MQPMSLCILSGRRFEDTLGNAQWGKFKPLQQVWLCILICKCFEDTWRCTVEKSQTNAASVIMQPYIPVIWGHIWRRTVEKNQTNATNAIMHHLIQALWRRHWKYTVQKVSQPDAFHKINDISISLSVTGWPERLVLEMLTITWKQRWWITMNINPNTSCYMCWWR